MKISVLGSGSWGTALSQVLADNGNDVIVYGVDRNEIEDINQNHKNSKYFGDTVINENLRATLDVSEVGEYNDLVLVVVPTQFITSALNSVKPYIKPNTIVVNAAKGFDWTTNRRISETIRSCFADTEYAGLCSIIGPSHAEEVILRQLTAVSAVSVDESLAIKVQHIFSNGYLRVYVTDDEIGAEYGVAIKNVIAIASGILDGQGYGDNAKAALITRGLREMIQYGVSLGGKKDTFFGLTGVGDLIVTCFSPHSRNYQAGLKIGKMNSAKAIEGNTATVEGIHSCMSVHEDAKKRGIEMPIVDSVYRVLFEGAEPAAEIAAIMGRKLKSEHFGEYD
ncbi:MAG: NAD(P)H-dependent glycerol-3-phosphate dehydrogenase [Eubacteriales bacterium]|nr:NAD(P)H-dependent glycerol-3-phosphate dehydrogenase [Eubacteriales bacterium]